MGSDSPARGAAELEFTEGPLDPEEDRQETKARLPRIRSWCLGEKHSKVESRPQEVDASGDITASSPGGGSSGLTAGPASSARPAVAHLFCPVKSLNFHREQRWENQPFSC